MHDSLEPQRGSDHADAQTQIAGAADRYRVACEQGARRFACHVPPIAILDKYPMGQGDGLSQR